jgi:hypothetical protein
LGLKRLGGVVDGTADDANLDRLARLRDQQPFLGQILQMQRDRLTGVGDGVLNRSSGRRAAQDVGYSDTVKVRVLGLLDFDAEA